MSARRFNSQDRPLFWDAKEADIFPYVIPSQNQKEAHEVSSILQSFREGASAFTNRNPQENLLSSCIPSKFGGVDHSIITRMYTIEQIEALRVKGALKQNSIDLQSLSQTEALYKTMYLPSMYLSSAQESTSESFLENLFQKIRQGDAICAVCLHSGDRLYDKTTTSLVLERPAEGSDGSYTISGVVQRVALADTVTHFIVPARLEVTEIIEGEDGESSEVKTWKTVLCIVPKNAGTFVQKNGNDFDAKFDKVQIKSVESFLCQPGDAVPLQSTVQISELGVLSAIILGRLRGLVHILKASLGDKVTEVLQNSIFRMNALVYALESALYLNASIQETKEEGLARASAMYSFAVGVLNDVLKMCESVECAPMAGESVIDLLQDTMKFVASAVSPLTIQHFLACFTVEESAVRLNNTSTLELMQQRALKKVGVGKSIRLLREAVEKRKAKSPASTRSKWLKTIDERLSELESTHYSAVSFVEKFVGKTGALLSHPQSQALSEFVRIQVELFVRFCALSRAFGALDNQEAAACYGMLTETFCAISNMKTKQLFAYFQPEGKESSAAMLNVNLDNKIFNDIFVKS